MCCLPGSLRERGGIEANSSSSSRAAGTAFGDSECASQAAHYVPKSSASSWAASLCFSWPGAVALLQGLQGMWPVPGPQHWLQRWGALVCTLSQGLPRCLSQRWPWGALAGGVQTLSVAGVVSCAQLRQLEMQLEQEYEEKQMVLHEKQDLEGLIGTLCEQVRGRCPPRGQPGRAAGGKGHAQLSSLLPPGQPNRFAGCAP